MLQNTTDPTNHPAIDPYTQDRVDYRVARLVGAFRLCEADADDLRQVLLLDLWRAMARYDQEQASVNTYINRVLDRAYCHHARKLRTRRRHASMSPVSLSAIAGGAGMVDGALMVGHREIDRAGAAMDLETAMAAMPRRLRIIAEELKHYSPREAAERLRVHRGTVYRAIAQIREHLLAHGVSASA